MYQKTYDIFKNVHNLLVCFYLFLIVTYAWQKKAKNVTITIEDKECHKYVILKSLKVVKMGIAKNRLLKNENDIIFSYFDVSKVLKMGKGKIIWL